MLGKDDTKVIMGRMTFEEETRCLFLFRLSYLVIMNKNGYGKASVSLFCERQLQTACSDSRIDGK